jgi:ribosomal protein S27E
MPQNRNDDASEFSLNNFLEDYDIADESLPDLDLGDNDLLYSDNREEESAEESKEDSEPKVFDTSNGKKNGLDKCPSCGSTDILYSIEKGSLICQSCRSSFSEDKLEKSELFDESIKHLRGDSIGSGARDIDSQASDIVTLKCGACGAEIALNTRDSLQARCHWCRNTLSLQEQIPNGAVPDGILPFSISKEEAISKIQEFVKKRTFFANSHFKKEFAPENVQGVYLPYLTLDASAEFSFNGVGEILTRRYTVGVGDNKQTRYDADQYYVSRSFDLFCDDLILESSKNRANQKTSENSNNILNALLPFDTKNAVRYNANYLRGFSSEKRDLNVSEVSDEMKNKLLSIARSNAQDTIYTYDRGVRWENEGLNVNGTKWTSMYLPIWIYSYYQKSNGFLHYVAVNGRNGEVMGSIPLNYMKLIPMSIGVSILGTIGSVLLLFAGN